MKKRLPKREFFNQVHPLEEDVKDDQDLVNPPPLMDGDIRDAVLHMAQAITTLEKVVSTQAQAMTSQANREVVTQSN